MGERSVSSTVKLHSEFPIPIRCSFNSLPKLSLPFTNQFAVIRGRNLGHERAGNQHQIQSISVPNSLRPIRGLL
jgi:hypothetical protein